MKDNYTNTLDQAYVVFISIFHSLEYEIKKKYKEQKEFIFCSPNLLTIPIEKKKRKKENQKGNTFTFVFSLQTTKQPNNQKTKQN